MKIPVKKMKEKVLPLLNIAYECLDKINMLTILYNGSEKVVLIGKP